MKKEPQTFHFEDMKFEKVGEKISLKIVEGTNITLLNCKFEKGCIIPNHRHESEQITIVVKGCLKGKINDKEYMVQSGKGIVIPPNLPHEWVALEETISLEVFSPPREKPSFSPVVKD
jgi:unsaturated pyranuronate lyase